MGCPALGISYLSTKFLEHLLDANFHAKGWELGEWGMVTRYKQEAQPARAKVVWSFTLQ